MKTEELKKVKNREGEKGAAMVMVLMLSSLLLIASVGLLMETSLNASNVTDAVAEQQAYNAAESGIQSAINVLRGNVLPNPLFNATQNHSDNRIDFRKAVMLSKSNKAGDTSTKARLSRWLSYDNTNPDRVKLGPGTYTPQNGYAYSVTVTDPDDTGSIISFNTSGRFYDPRDKQWKTSIAYGSGLNTASISYNSFTKSNLNVSSGSATTNFGGFQILTTGTGANFTDDIRFQVIVNMTAPYTATKILRGTIKPGLVILNSVGTLKFDFDSQVHQLMGSTITLDNDPLNPNPANVNSGITTVSGSMTQAEPYRVVIRSIGYGPRGARKELEATVQKNFFNGLSAPATLTLIGSTSGFLFKPGTSNNVTYSGDDVVSSINIPSIGTTNETNLDTIKLELSQQNVKTDPQPPPEDITSELPFWLQNASNLHSTLESLKVVAKASGRYYSNGQQPSSGDLGNVLTGEGITYVDGDMEISQQGGGILVVTGKLTLRGNFTFRGLIIVTGSGGVSRNGGGNGYLFGNTVIVPYDPNNLGAGFSSPKYDISGGGNSEIRYHSDSVANGMTAVSNFVLGVAEK